MFLRFIGEDGSMGLKHGQVYRCQIYTDDGFICVSWKRKWLTNRMCPYRSLKALTENWETVEWEQKSK